MLLMILGALIVGLTMGLTGTGGSIITVPVLTYVLGHNGKVAIPESLAIVGGVALFALLPYARARQVNWRSVAFFGAAGMVATYAGAWMSRYVSAAAQLSLFAIVMLGASALMLRGPHRPDTPQSGEAPALSIQARWKIALQGAVVGFLTGLVGVGGGILIVPALAVMGKLPLRTAVGTSLALIALNSFTGFFKYVQWLQQMGTSVNWWTISTFVFFGAVGSLGGSFLGSKIDQQKLRQAFAVFLFGVALLILGREVPRVREEFQPPVVPHGCVTGDRRETLLSCNRQAARTLAVRQRSFSPLWKAKLPTNRTASPSRKVRFSQRESNACS